MLCSPVSIKVRVLLTRASRSQEGYANVIKSQKLMAITGWGHARVKNKDDKIDGGEH